MTSLQDYVKAFAEAGDIATAAAYALQAQKAQLAADLVPRFWAAVSAAGSDDPAAGLDASLARSLEDLCMGVAGQQQQLAALAQHLLAAVPSCSGGWPAGHAAVASLQQRYMHAVAVHLVGVAPVSLHSLLTICLDAKLSQWAADSPVQLEVEGDDSKQATDMEQNVRLEDVMGADWLAPLASVQDSLATLGIPQLLEEAAVGVACAHVQQALSTHAAGDFRASILADAASYAAAVPLEFLCAVLQPQDDQQVQQWRQYLQHFVSETVGRLRIGELFDIVVDYPDSLPAVHDVRDCLAHAALQQHLVSQLRAAIHKRLLHAGAATTDIIVQYVSTIKALREMDASGVLLEAIADPICEYLRSRKDTIRCIVTMLTDDSAGDVPGGESLFQELDRPDHGPEDVSDAEMDDDEAALAAAEAWEPDPVLADPRRSSRTRRMSDVIAALIGIYGSKELFITEYRLMLADRLAGKSDFDTQRERRTMELLKLRFGEANLHNADIMLGDVAASKRINAFVHAAKPELGRFKTTIVSELFWPPLQGEAVELPPQISAALDAFAEEYRKLKAPRKLQWKPSLGSVQLVVSAGGVQRELRVTALQASVLLRFKERPTWLLDELALVMKLSPLVLRKSVIFWASQGILQLTEQPGGNARVERVENMQSAPTAAAQANEEPSSSVVSAEEQHQRDRAMFDQYVLGMLANFDGMPLDRIHNMLKMFVQEPHPYDKSQEQLSDELARLVGCGKLVASGNMYRIVRSE